MLQSTSLIRGKTILPRLSGHASLMLQSTSLIRGKTIAFAMITSYHIRFNPLPSSEGRRYRFSNDRRLFPASIHFPHPREDSHGADTIPPRGSFNPLPSSEGRRGYYGFLHFQKGASIHFPHPREDARSNSSLS